MDRKIEFSINIYLEVTIKSLKCQLHMTFPPPHHWIMNINWNLNLSIFFLTARVGAARRRTMLAGAAAKFLGRFRSACHTVKVNNKNKLMVGNTEQKWRKLLEFLKIMIPSYLLHCYYWTRGTSSQSRSWIGFRLMKILEPNLTEKAQLSNTG